MVKWESNPGTLDPFWWSFFNLPSAGTWTVVTLAIQFGRWDHLQILFEILLLKKNISPPCFSFSATLVSSTLAVKNSRESHDDVQRFLKIQFEAQSRRCVTSLGKKRRSTGGAETSRGKPGKWNKPIQLEATKANWWAVFTQEKKKKTNQLWCE